MKAISIKISKDNLLAEISWLLWCAHLYMLCSSLKSHKIDLEGELSPNTHFYIALYSIFCSFIGISFNNVTLKLKINHDNGTVQCKGYIKPLKQYKNHNISMRISSIGIGATTTALINRVYLIYLWLICSLVQAPLNRIGNSKITFPSVW